MSFSELRIVHNCCLLCNVCVCLCSIYSSVQIIYLVLNLAYQWAERNAFFLLRSGYFCDPSLGVWQLPRINEYSWILRFLPSNKIPLYSHSFLARLIFQRESTKWLFAVLLPISHPTYTPSSRERDNQFWNQVDMLSSAIFSHEQTIISEITHPYVLSTPADFELAF